MGDKVGERHVGDRRRDCGTRPGLRKSIFFICRFSQLRIGTQVFRCDDGWGDLKDHHSHYWASQLPLQLQIDCARKIADELICSCKFPPTAGFSILTSMPAASRTLGLPMPDSSRSCGDCTLPAHRMTSPSNLITCSSPPYANLTPFATHCPSSFSRMTS